jgi:HSP20 family molecular chaperone IbpA
MSERDLIKKFNFRDWFDDFYSIAFNEATGTPVFQKTYLGFPYHDVYTTNNDETLVLEIAIAGYSKEDIKINIENDCVVITAENESSKNEESNKRNYSIKGISRKSFSHQWKIPSKYSSEPTAEFKDGILKIKFSIQEDKKSKQIEIK